MNEPRERTLGTLLFPEFELLDVFGPLEMFGNLPGAVRTLTVAEQSGAVTSAQGTRVIADYSLAQCPDLDLLLIPGGMGTRRDVENSALCEWIAARSAGAEIVMTVCTGTALLARTGVLDGHRATTNKMMFPWVSEQGPSVVWVREARWVEDGKFVTSSGVSAGTDMALAVIARLFGADVSERLAIVAEYEWQRDPSVDRFAAIHGLV